MQKDELIRSLAQKKDPRSAKWQNKVILDTLQELGSSSASDLVKAINAKYKCEPELMTYNQVYGDIIVLKGEGILDFNTITKQYSVKEEYVTVTEQIKYLPISNYCVGLFAISVVGLIASIYFNVMLSESLLLVIVGAFYLGGQLVGSEFDYEERVETAIIANGAKSIHKKLVEFTGTNLENN